MPIDTAVTATAVESASPAVVTSSTNAMDRCFGAVACWGSRSISTRLCNVLDNDISVLRESVFQFDATSRGMPAPIRSDLGEAVDE
jgi:hypothetical protein